MNFRLSRYKTLSAPTEGITRYQEIQIHPSKGSIVRPRSDLRMATDPTYIPLELFLLRYIGSKYQGIISELLQDKSHFGGKKAENFLSNFVAKCFKKGSVRRENARAITDNFTGVLWTATEHMSVAAPTALALGLPLKTLHWFARGVLMALPIPIIYKSYHDFKTVSIQELTLRANGLLHDHSSSAWDTIESSVFTLPVKSLFGKIIRTVMTPVRLFRHCTKWGRSLDRHMRMKHEVEAFVRGAKHLIFKCQRPSHRRQAHRLVLKVFRETKSKVLRSMMMGLILRITSKIKYIYKGLAPSDGSSVRALESQPTSLSHPLEELKAPLLEEPNPDTESSEQDIEMGPMIKPTSPGDAPPSGLTLSFPQEELEADLETDKIEDTKLLIDHIASLVDVLDTMKSVQRALMQYQLGIKTARSKWAVAGLFLLDLLARGFKVLRAAQ